MRHIAYAGLGSLNTPTFWTCYSVDHKTGTILQKKNTGGTIHNSKIEFYIYTSLQTYNNDMTTPGSGHNAECMQRKFHRTLLS
jgi:hypothetical protein